MRESRLVLFDIDGTLTATNDVDTECYTQAVAETLGLIAADIAWTESPHISDTGILRWLWQRHRGCVPTAAELSAVRTRLVTLLDDQLRQNPERFLAVPGAVDALERLQADGWTIAFATGGWGPSARLKLAAARLPADLPIFCSDDAFEREAIVSLARDHCLRAAGRPFDRIVSVGDGVWDVRTARQLKLPFVGIATGAKAERLTELGTSHVIPDLEYRRLRKALAAAQVPASSPTIRR